MLKSVKNDVFSTQQSRHRPLLFYKDKTHTNLKPGVGQIYCEVGFLMYIGETIQMEPDWLKKTTTQIY